MAQYHQQLKTPSPQRSLGEFAERLNPYCLKDRPEGTPGRFIASRDGLAARGLAPYSYSAI